MPEEWQESGWVIHPSLWFDAVCLIPLLAGLPFYTSRHDQDARWWQERFASIAGQEARDGVSVLRQEVAQRAAKPLPAFLALWTSPAAGPCDRAAECLDDLVTAVADRRCWCRPCGKRLRAGTRPMTGCSVRSVPPLSAVLEGLRAAGLADWWAEHAEGGLQRRCGELRQSFAGYDLVPLVEQHTGVSFDARAVELCVLRWAAPHGIRVTGTRFLTDVRYEADRVLNIAVHELLHPPWPQAIRSRTAWTRSLLTRSSRPASPGGTRMPGTTPGTATPRKTRPRRSTSSSIPAWDATPEETR